MGGGSVVKTLDLAQRAINTGLWFWVDGIQPMKVLVKALEIKAY